jgi:CubicO group peptidase (beta-lactamase class C family)
MTVPLAPSTPAALGLDPQPLERLGEIITGHLAEGRYPGAQIAVARRGQLALFRTFGDARLDPARAPAREDTLWLMYSNTKVITACAVWILAERGALSYTDRVADHVPGFEAHGKGDITIIQLLSHQAGFPNADVPVEAWTDHDLLKRTVCDYTLEWTGTVSSRWAHINSGATGCIREKVDRIGGRRDNCRRVTRPTLPNDRARRSPP